MANTNLFYDLYSKSNNVTNAPYVCRNVVDEEDTSFDIMQAKAGSNINGTVGAITDSNGNTLASISLADIHAAGITQYVTEVKILQPYSCNVIQGQEFGLACASYFYRIPKLLVEVENYENYTQCEFDIVYNNFKPMKFHVDALPNNEEFVNVINKLLSENNIPVTASIQVLSDYISGNEYEYLVFTSTKLGYFYYIINIKLVPLFQSEDYPDSPFSSDIDDLNTIIYDLIMEYHPVKENELYDEETYEVDCDLYKWLLIHYEKCLQFKENFKNFLDLIDSITPDMPAEEQDEILERANNLIKYTPYDLLTDYNVYDANNLRIICNIVYALAEIINDAQSYYQSLYWLIEDRFKRIPLMKYPNGAFRGLCLIPDWPKLNEDKFEYSSLWINHIKNEVKLYKPTKNGEFLPKIYGVLASASILGEENDFRKGHPEFSSLENSNTITNIPDGWNDVLRDDTLDTNYLDPYRPSHSIYEDSIYMGLNGYANKDSVIGLFRYMQYVDDEKLWNKVGLVYTIIGNPDDPQSTIKNLPLSLLVYNPNPYPIRIKYMIFS